MSINIKAERLTDTLEH